ncbi:hypothetical protein PF004_g25474, partial [Phytophthora fragariae]
SKALQGANVSLLDVRVWFDGLIAIKPHYATYLGPRADIVHSPDFESGCVRVLGGKANRLTRAVEPSVARTTYGQERHSLQPITLEMLLFLRQNEQYWSAQTVYEATR